jgi:hypothetical protein
MHEEAMEDMRRQMSGRIATRTMVVGLALLLCASVWMMTGAPVLAEGPDPVRYMVFGRTITGTVMIEASLDRDTLGDISSAPALPAASSGEKQHVIVQFSEEPVSRYFAVSSGEGTQSGDEIGAEDLAALASQEAVIEEEHQRAIRELEANGVDVEQTAEFSHSWRCKAESGRCGTSGWQSGRCREHGRGRCSGRRSGRDTGYVPRDVERCSCPSVWDAIRRNPVHD